MLLEQFLRINTIVDELLYLSYNTGTVGSVCYAEPLTGCIKHLYGSSLIIDQFVYHQWDEELCLQIFHVLRVRKELFEVLLAILKIVGSEAPHIH